MKFKYWIACTIFTCGSIAGNAAAQPNYLKADNTTLAQVRPAAPISERDRQELQQLRQEKLIGDRIQAEVDRAFMRTTTSIYILLFLMALFPIGTALGLWLFRRSIIDRIVSEAKHKLHAEITKQIEVEVSDTLEKQTAAFQNEVERLRTELLEYLNQLKNLYADEITKDAPAETTVYTQPFPAIRNLLALAKEEQNGGEPSYENYSELANLGEQESEILAEVQGQQLLPSSNDETEESASSSNSEVLTAVEYFNQGNVLMAEGRYAEANKSYNHAVQLERDFPEARYQNARAYALRGSVNAAVGNLQWAIDIDASYQERAKTDSAFDPIRADEQFKKIIDE